MAVVQFVLGLILFVSGMTFVVKREQIVAWRIGRAGGSEVPMFYLLMGSAYALIGLGEVVLALR